MNIIRVMLVDDHSLVRAGIRSVLAEESGIEVIGEAGDGAKAVEMSRRLCPDIITMDIRMPWMNGIEATARIAANNPKTQLLVLTSYCVADDIRAALESGASGALMKSTSGFELAKSIRLIANGGRFVDAKLEFAMRQHPPLPRLSARQHEILSAMTRGLTNRDISVLLGLSQETVNEYAHLIFEKLGVANRTEAVSAVLSRRLSYGA